MASQIDHILIHWGEEILWNRESTSVKKKPPTQIHLQKPNAKGSGSGITSDKVRQHLRMLVRKAPQVMVKITGGGADMRKIGAHIDYIARGGRYKKKDQPELVIETDDGNVAQGPQARKNLKELFEQCGTPIPKEIHEAGLGSSTTIARRKRREALNVILSMPHGISRDLVKAAARSTANKLFANHLFAMVHHEDTNHQHTHIVVKMVGHDGQRLNPRKADLEQWRITFANELNARGVDAAATRRRVRLQPKTSESQAVRQIKDRGQAPRREKTAITQPVAKARAQANDARIGNAYRQMAIALSTSPDKQDQELGAGLRKFLASMGIKHSAVKPNGPRQGR